MQKILNRVKVAASVCLTAAVVILVGCKSSPDRTAGQRIDDHRVTSKVKGALNSETVYKFQDVRVDTYKGAVQLSGWVTTEEQKTRAAELAKTVPEVTMVVNNITIKPDAGLTPTGREKGRETEPTYKPGTNGTTNIPSGVTPGSSTTDPRP